MNYTLEPMKLEINKYIYVGCIPVHACPEHPTDQSPCIKMDCPYCKREMWVSKKKREILYKDPKRVKIYCLECLAVGAWSQGYDPELFDIGVLD